MNRRLLGHGSLMVPAVLILILVLTGVLFLLRQKPSVREKEIVEEIYMPGYPLYKEDVERVPVELLFPGRDLALKAEDREIYRSAEPVNRLRQVLVLLIKGPRSEDLFPVFPVGTRLRELYLHDGCACIDLKLAPEIKPNMGMLMEYLTVRSVQASLMKNFPEVETVKIVLNGQEADTLFGHVDIRGSISTLFAGDGVASSDRDF